MAPAEMTEIVLIIAVLSFAILWSVCGKLADRVGEATMPVHLSNPSRTGVLLGDLQHYLYLSIAFICLLASGTGVPKISND
jgi:hypothetical protein